jgi:hypothetical protein
MLAKIAELLDVALSVLLEGTAKAGPYYKPSEFSVLLEQIYQSVFYLQRHTNLDILF